MMKVSLDGSFKVRELQVRFRTTRYTSPAKITSPTHVHDFLRPIIKDKPRELLISLALDASNKVVGFEIVSQGTSDSALAIPREALKAVLLTNANAFILAHNHPSGNCEPSLEDRQTAKRMAQASAMLDIKLLDFMVVTEDAYYSFAQSEPSSIQIQ
jgi:DNA repair protein RadC